MCPIRFPLILKPEVDERGTELKLNFQQKHIDIIRAIMAPEPDSKLIDVLCGIGFGKTTIAIMVAAAVMELYSESRIMFLEPDSDKLETVFWAEWHKWIPEEAYSVKSVMGKKQIHWHNGAILYPRHRWASGNRSMAADIMRGPNLTLILDDEAAIKFNQELCMNGLGRLRVPCPVTGYITLTTPKIGGYRDWILQPGHVVFNGRTADNAANHKPGFEKALREIYGPTLSKRELDGEMVSLEGRIWDMFDLEHDVLDGGNIDDASWDRGRPYILAGDLGVQSSWLIIQKHFGREVIVGQYHPDHGGTKQDIGFILGKYKQPSKIIIGRDVNTQSQVSGDSAALELRNALQRHRLTQIQIDFPRGDYTDKSVQYNSLTSIMERRILTLSRNCIVDGNNKRGVRQVIEQDEWPTASVPYWFNKDKRRSASGINFGLEDCRDTMLYYAVCQHPLTIDGVI